MWDQTYSIVKKGKRDKNKKWQTNGAFMIILIHFCIRRVCSNPDLIHLFAIHWFTGHRSVLHTNISSNVINTNTNNIFTTCFIFVIVLQIYGGKDIDVMCTVMIAHWRHVHGDDSTLTSCTQWWLHINVMYTVMIAHGRHIDGDDTTLTSRWW